MEQLPLEIISKIMLYNITFEAYLMRDSIQRYKNHLVRINNYLPDKKSLNFSTWYFINLIGPQPA